MVAACRYPVVRIPLVVRGKVAGGAKVTAIAGVGGWSSSETDQLCRKINSLALPTLMETMDGLEEAVAALNG